MLSPPLTPVKPHRSPPSVNLHPPVTDLYKYLAPANWAGKHLRGKTGWKFEKTCKERRGSWGDSQKESVAEAEKESKSVIERDGNRKERLG